MYRNCFCLSEMVGHRVLAGHRMVQSQKSLRKLTPLVSSNLVSSILSGTDPNTDSRAPNDGFLLNALKTLFRLSRVLLDL